MSWLSRIRGAIGMGVTWAIGWAIAGILVGVSSRLLPFLPWDRFFEVFDAPLPALAIPGFFSGVFFSIVLGVAARRRRFSELSVPLFAALGAAGGLLLSLFPVALIAVGLASVHEGKNVWYGLAVVSGPFILLSAASAAVTLLVARKAEQSATLENGDESAHAALRDGAVRELRDGVELPNASVRPTRSEPQRPSRGS